MVKNNQNKTKNKTNNKVKNKKINKSSILKKIESIDKIIRIKIKKLSIISDYVKKIIKIFLQKTNSIFKKVISRINKINNNINKKIFTKRTKYYIRKFKKILGFATISAFIILMGIFIKFKPVYVVSVNGEKIGQISNKEEFEKRINEEVLTSTNSCAVFTSLEYEPTYELLLSEDKNTNEDEIISKLSNEATTMYKVYAIVVNGEEKSYVTSWDDAEKAVSELSNEYASLTNIEITATEKYTNDIENVGTLELAEAESSISGELREIKDEQERIASATVNGVYLSVKPVSGSITSRFGAVESIRDHTHKGIDIAAPVGTKIKAAAAGTVITSEYNSGGYGYLIIIDHGNGVQTYYGHCSKLYVTAGTKVDAGDVIAAVGSTGDSTGNHLHFEVRVNGTQINPQNYIYK